MNLEGLASAFAELRVIGIKIDMSEGFEVKSGFAKDLRVAGDRSVSHPCEAQGDVATMMKVGSYVLAIHTRLLVFFIIGDLKGTKAFDGDSYGDILSLDL